MIEYCGTIFQNIQIGFIQKHFFYFKLHFLLLFATFYLLDWYCNVLKGPQYFLLPPCMIMQFVSWHLKKLREFECSRADSRLSSTKCYGFKPGFCHSVTLWMQARGAELSLRWGFVIGVIPTVRAVIRVIRDTCDTCDTFIVVLCGVVCKSAIFFKYMCISMMSPYILTCYIHQSP